MAMGGTSASAAAPTCAAAFRLSPKITLSSACHAIGTKNQYHIIPKAMIRKVFIHPPQNCPHVCRRQQAICQIKKRPIAACKFYSFFIYILLFLFYPVKVLGLDRIRNLWLVKRQIKTKFATINKVEIYSYFLF